MAPQPPKMEEGNVNTLCFLLAEWMRSHGFVGYTEF